MQVKKTSNQSEKSIKTATGHTQKIVPRPLAENQSGSLNFRNIQQESMLKSKPLLKKRDRDPFDNGQCSSKRPKVETVIWDLSDGDVWIQRADTQAHQDARVIDLTGSLIHHIDFEAVNEMPHLQKVILANASWQERPCGFRTGIEIDWNGDGTDYGFYFSQQPLD